jgi:hypothetical protein
MATFLGIHDMGGGMPDDKAKGSWEAYKAACDKLGSSAMHVHYSAEKGRAFCLTEAATADDVQKAHDEAGVPVNEILEVQTSE